MTGCVDKNMKWDHLTEAANSITIVIQNAQSGKIFYTIQVLKHWNLQKLATDFVVGSNCYYRDQN